MTKCLQINILYGWSREQRNILRKDHNMLSRVLSPFLGCRTYSARLSVRSISDNITIRDVDLSNFPTEKIRNFSIVAHIDHGKKDSIVIETSNHEITAGKSTLADRILELVGAIDVSPENKQVGKSLRKVCKKLPQSGLGPGQLTS